MNRIISKEQPKGLFRMDAALLTIGASDELLMTLDTLFLVVGGVRGWVRQASLKESKHRFIDIVWPRLASEEQRQEIIFRVLAKRPWLGTAQAEDQPNWPKWG